MWERFQHLSALPPFRHVGTPKAMLPRKLPLHSISLAPLLAAACFFSAPCSQLSSAFAWKVLPAISTHSEPPEPLRPSLSVTFPPEPTWPLLPLGLHLCEPSTPCPVVWLLLDTAHLLCLPVTPALVEGWQSELNWEHRGKSGGSLGRMLFQNHWNTLCWEFPRCSALCPSPRVGKALPKALGLESRLTFPQAPEPFLSRDGPVGVHCPAVLLAAVRPEVLVCLKSDLHHVRGLGTGYRHGPCGAARQNPGDEAGVWGGGGERVGQCPIT